MMRTVFKTMLAGGAPSSSAQFVGRRGPPRTCRFCGRSPPDTTFKQKKHVIPEALGNRSLFSEEECDSCNNEASKLESELAAHLTLARLFSRLPNKPAKGRSRQSFKHRFGRDVSSLERPSFADPVSIGASTGEQSVRLKRTEDGFAITCRVPTYSLANVVKSLVRMALFVAEEDDLQRLSHCRAWLRGETSWPSPVFWESFIPRTAGDRVGLLLQHDDSGSGRAPYCLYFTYAGTFIGLPIPDQSWSVSKLWVPELQQFSHDPVKVRVVQFAGEGRRDRPFLSVDVAAPDLAGVPPPTRAEIEAAAHSRYEKRGRSHGQDVDDWLEAEQDLLFEQLDLVISSTDERTGHD